MADRTAKQLAAGHRRSLHAMSTKLRNLAAEWGDRDDYNMRELEDLAERVDRAADVLIDNAAAD